MCRVTALIQLASLLCISAIQVTTRRILSKRSLEIGYVQFTVGSHHHSLGDVHHAVTVYVPSVIHGSHNETQIVRTPHVLVTSHEGSPEAAALVSQHDKWVPGYVKNHAFVPGHVAHVVVPAHTLVVTHAVHAVVLHPVHPVDTHRNSPYRRHYGGFGAGIEYGGHGAGHGYHVV